MTPAAESPRVRLAASIFTLFIIALCLGLYKVLAPFLPAATWAVAIALTTWPLYHRLCRSLGERRQWAPLCMTTVAAVLVVGVVLPIGVGVAKEVRHAATALQRYVTPHSLDRIVDGLPWIGTSVKARLKSYRQRLDTLGVLSEHQGAIVGVATSAARGVVMTAFNLAVCFLVLYSLYARGERIGNEMYVVLNEVGGERFQRILTEAREVTRASVYGMVMTAIVQGALAALGYYFAGAPVPLFLGVVTIVASLLPFGAPIVYLPVSIIVGIRSQSATPGVLLALWGLAVVSIIDNILRPYFISHASRQSFLTVLAGVIGGYVGFGFVGIIVGPGLLAIARILWFELLPLHLSASNLRARGESPRSSREV